MLNVALDWSARISGALIFMYGISLFGPALAVWSRAGGLRFKAICLLGMTAGVLVMASGYTGVFGVYVGTASNLGVQYRWTPMLILLGIGTVFGGAASALVMLGSGGEPKETVSGDE